jgi:Raf kinase inhibitor-like YbhB/YbcL family protein
MIHLLTALLLSGAAHAMELKSPTIAPGATIPNKHVFNGFGCSGGNERPELSWTGAPADSKSFAVLVHDPDAPTGGAGWWHWVAYDIPAGTSALSSTKLPEGTVQGPTDFGAPGFGGPCPPPGDKPHRYHFTVHALKVAKLELPPGASASLIGFMVNANSIAKAELTGIYGR